MLELVLVFYWCTKVYNDQPCRIVINAENKINGLTFNSGSAFSNIYHLYKYVEVLLAQCVFIGEMYIKGH